MVVMERIVCVSDTDLTKALYFTSQLRFVQEAFEKHLGKTYPEIGKLFLQQKIAMPIVATKANYLLPIFAGDVLLIQLDLEFGESSFTVKGTIIHDGKEKGLVMIKHVCLDAKTMKRVSSKDLFHGLLEF